MVFYSSLASLFANYGIRIVLLLLQPCEQFTASLNLHDGALHGRKHYLMCKNRTGRTTWIEDDDLFSEKRNGASASAS